MLFHRSFAIITVEKVLW